MKKLLVIRVGALALWRYAGSRFVFAGTRPPYETSDGRVEGVPGDYECAKLSPIEAHGLAAMLAAFAREAEREDGTNQSVEPK